MAPTCTSCKFFKKSGWLEIRGPFCTNSKCDEEAWTYTDIVTGDIREYERRNATCQSARWGACGTDGKLWEPL